MSLDAATNLPSLGVPSNVYRLLAASVDGLHALSMLVWGLGFPLLIWHRYRRWSEAYMLFAVAFVVVSVASHWLLGECVLTTLARSLWHAGGGYRDGTPFTAYLANLVAGVRPTRQEVVIAWELGILLTSVATLWYWFRTRGARLD